MATINKIKFPGFPPRPISGGKPSEAMNSRIQSRSESFAIEPKYNGWRVIVHQKSGLMFNRHGERSSVDPAKVSDALEMITKWDADVDPPQWLDCELLLNRHPLAKGTLMVIDAYWSGRSYRTGVHPYNGSYIHRKTMLARAFPAHGWEEGIKGERFRGIARFNHLPNQPVHTIYPFAMCDTETYLTSFFGGFKMLNNITVEDAMTIIEENNSSSIFNGEPFYEGVVIKRTGKMKPSGEWDGQMPYKFERREKKSTDWIKFRFDQ